MASVEVSVEYVPLGRTGVRVSRLAMGTMSFGADPSADAEVFAACRDAGINLFDCADVYRDGESERALGRLAKSERDALILTTKAFFPMSADPNARGSSRYHLVRAVEASLKRLDTDRIDILFLHRFDPDTALDETLRAVDDLVRQGKILYPAVSNFAAWQTQAALGEAALRGLSPIVASQPMYNLVKRQAEVEILPMCEANGLAVFPYGPLGGGLLTGKYLTKGERGRLVDNAMYAVRYAGTFGVAEAFVALAGELGVHPVTLAIAWVASHPAVTAPLIGARNLAQLGPALAAADLELSADVRSRVSALTAAPPPATDRNEERAGVRYKKRR